MHGTGGGTAAELSLVAAPRLTAVGGGGAAGAGSGGAAGAGDGGGLPALEEEEEEEEVAAPRLTDVIASPQLAQLYRDTLAGRIPWGESRDPFIE